MALSVPYLPYDRLRTVAEIFLEQHHASRAIPVPIEQIVEFRFEIDIVPVPGLHRAFDIDSMISKDLQRITVDEAVFESFPGRYRFSLAHELGHRILHAEVYRKLEFTDIEGWKQAICSIDEKDYGRMEFQAYAFAGLILVPPRELEDRFQEAMRRAESRGLTLQADSDVARQSVAYHLSKDFLVSADVIERRIKYDGLWET